MVIAGASEGSNWFVGLSGMTSSFNFNFNTTIKLDGV